MAVHLHRGSCISTFPSPTLRSLLCRSDDSRRGQSMKLGRAMSGVLAVAAFLFAGCSRSGSMAGDVFLTTKAADVKRAAGIRVCLIPDSEPFGPRLRSLIDREVRPLKSRAAQLTAEHTAAVSECRDINSRGPF